MADKPHFTLPFQWALAPAGGLAAREVEQESLDEDAACCEAIIRTVQGERTTLPAFGRPQLEFNSNPELVRATLAQALREFEPRVEPMVSAAPSTDDDLVQIVQALLAPADNEEGGG